jgi:4-aminobutyrate aminotransferase-like enzyme
MAASPHELAAALANRLQAVAPEQLRIRAEGADVVVVFPDGAEAAEGACRILGDNDGRSLTDKVSTAVRQVTSGTQDSIVRSFGAPWQAPAWRVRRR